MCHLNKKIKVSNKSLIVEKEICNNSICRIIVRNMFVQELWCNACLSMTIANVISKAEVVIEIVTLDLFWPL